MSAKEPARNYHCSTCGERYSSTGYERERGDGMLMWVLDNPHHCKLPQGRFFERTEIEYEYREGVKRQREVTYRIYSGHHIRFESDTIASSSWIKSPEPINMKGTINGGRTQVSTTTKQDSQGSISSQSGEDASGG